MSALIKWDMPPQQGGKKILENVGIQGYTLLPANLELQDLLEALLELFVFCLKTHLDVLLTIVWQVHPGNANTYAGYQLRDAGKTRTDIAIFGDKDDNKRMFHGHHTWRKYLGDRFHSLPWKVQEFLLLLDRCLLLAEQDVMKLCVMLEHELPGMTALLFPKNGGRPDFHFRLIWYACIAGRFSGKEHVDRGFGTFALRENKPGLYFKKSRAVLRDNKKVIEPFDKAAPPQFTEFQRDGSIFFPGLTFDDFIPQSNPHKEELCGTLHGVEGNANEGEERRVAVLFLNELSLHELNLSWTDTHPKY